MGVGIVTFTSEKEHLVTSTSENFGTSFIRSRGHKSHIFRLALTFTSENDSFARSSLRF